MKKQILIIFSIALINVSLFGQKYITIDFSVETGYIKDIYGGNKGTDTLEAIPYLHEIGIKHIRTHDYHGGADYFYYSNFWNKDGAGNFIDINPTWIKTLGYTREEIIGNWFGDFLHPDFVEHFRKNFSNFKKNGFIHNVQFKIKHKQGNYLFIAFEGIVGYNPNGSIKQTFCTFKDITTEFYVKEELIKAKEHAEESDRLKSAFLANMSHEIRTPMNGILGFSKLLKERGLTGKQQQKYIDIIEKGGARMLNIINDIVNISKIESGQMEVNIQLSNINEQIEYIYTFFKPDIEGKGMQFSFLNSLPSKEAIIKTDREKVYAILTNLVKNAIKYSEKRLHRIGL